MDVPSTSLGRRHPFNYYSSFCRFLFHEWSDEAFCLALLCLSVLSFCDVSMYRLTLVSLAYWCHDHDKGAYQSHLCTRAVRYERGSFNDLSKHNSCVGSRGCKARLDVVMTSMRQIKRESVGLRWDHFRCNWVYLQVFCCVSLWCSYLAADDSAVCVFGGLSKRCKLIVCSSTMSDVHEISPMPGADAAAQPLKGVDDDRIAISISME